jgi:hypothetical protein
MSLLSPPPSRRGGPQSPDNVDDILRAFFRRQMPDPWPSPEAAPLRRVAPAPARRRPLLRSRLALAASVALLAGTLLLVAQAFQGRPKTTPGQGLVTQPTADSGNDFTHHPTQPVIPTASIPHTAPTLQITTVKLTVVGAAAKTEPEGKAGVGDVSPGAAKPGGPGAVSVAATPLDHGRMKVAVEFYPEGESRLQTIACEGGPEEINRQIESKVPARERAMVQEALKRIRLLNAPTDADQPAPAGP